MASPDDVDDFICSSFRSIWSLELLLFLDENAGRSWSQEDLVEALRASDLIVSQSVDALVAAGLVSLDEDGCARFAPASADLAQMVAMTRQRYRRGPSAVRRLILTSVSGGLSAFADAFKFRKD